MTRDEWAKHTAARLVQEHKSVLKNWPQGHLEIWLRDGCRCVYCGRDLLLDRDITYFLYSYDHLLPLKKYPQLKTSSWNRVVVCRACNSWKSSFDPADAGITPTEGSREALIERARLYIREQRKSAEALFLKEREILTTALREYEVGKAAHA